MGFGLHTIAHLAGDVTAPVLKGAGAVSGSSFLTNAGNAIADPNVVYAGSINPFSNPSGSTSLIHNGGTSGFVAVNNPSSGAAPHTTANASQASSAPTNQTSQTTTYSTGPSAQDVAAYNMYQSQANADLAKLLNSYNATTASLNNNYNTQNAQLDSSKAQTENTYNTNVTDQNQNLLRQQNQIRQGTYNAYQNLMNLLGAYGGGGTSVAQQWAPSAAQHFQNTQEGTANQTTATNLRDLNTRYNNYLNQYDNQKKQLVDTHNQDIANAQSKYNDTRDSLARILDAIKGRNLTPDTIGSSLSGINVPSINFVQPTYNGQTPVYNAPNLSTFEASIPTASFAQPAAVSNSAATPALAVLLDQQKKQQQPTA